jgi:hypothetical protein
VGLVGPAALQIPPNTVTQFQGVTVLKEPTILHNFQPHMHYRGKAMEIKVTYPDGRTEGLLSVPNYSFAWQTAYKPNQPIRIPSGSKITVTGHFDNSSKNKFNPDPAKNVRYGEPTYDEMMMGFLDYIVEKPAARMKVDPKLFDAYIGRYDLGNNRVYVVTREGDRYFGQATANPRRELFALSQDRFLNPEVESHLTFIKNDKGEVVEMLFERGEGSARYKRMKDGEPEKK